MSGRIWLMLPWTLEHSIRVLLATHVSSISIAISALETSMSPDDDNAKVTDTLGLPSTTRVSSFKRRAYAAATPVILKVATRARFSGSLGSPIERVARRSSVRVIVMSFLCGIFVFALKSSLSLPFLMLPPPSVVSSSEAPVSSPVSSPCRHRLECINRPQCS